MIQGDSVQDSASLRRQIDQLKATNRSIESSSETQHASPLERYEAADRGDCGLRIPGTLLATVRCKGRET